MYLTTLVLLTWVSWYARTHAYIWPSPYDVLEDAYVLSSGFGSDGTVDEVTPCSLSPAGGTTTGRQNTAEWLRTAYHDMATHDATTGLGGLDGSIQFETDRPENIGTAMNTTVEFFGPLQSKRASFADRLALGVVLAIKNCGGPAIPYRAGRIDATEAGALGVPQPEQSLETHVTAFARQGFNLTEMIGLVACGHTVGGVHEIDFPHTVQGAITSDNPEGVVHFDDTFDVYDNHIAAQYINGTSTDPLVVGFNTTTNSDARIFSADGNRTMQSFAMDPDFFVSRCGALLETMLNTVPAGVTLSDVIEPLVVKPHELRLFFTSTGGLTLSGNIRIFGTSPVAAAADPADMPVTLIWTDRNGGKNANYSTTGTSSSFMAATSLWGAVQLFSVSTPIDPSTGISSFVVDWAYNSQLSLTTSDNGGSGFPIQDTVLFQPVKSCHGAVDQNSTINAVIRNDMGDVTSAYIEYTHSATQLGSMALKQITIRADFVHVGNSSSPFYDTYTTSFLSNDGFLSLDEDIVSFDLFAIVGGKTYSSSDNPQLFTPC
ncbi:heme peroxidase [Mycena leptocephala]|nr:heme peroxidase [Mycena leptocephala]